MSRASKLIVLGLLIFLAPFSGLPYSWLDVLTPLLGIAVFAVGFTMRAERVRSQAAESVTATPAAAPHGPSPLA